MKNFLFAVLLIVFGFTSCVNKSPEAAPVKKDISEFIGHWTLDIDGGWVGWLEVRQEEGYLDGALLWKWGSVEPVSGMFLAKDSYIVATRTWDNIRKRDAEGNPVRVHKYTEWIEAEVDGDRIKGFMLNPKNNGLGIDSVSFTGVRLPAVPAAPDLKAVKYGEPVALFNGKDLTGWKLIDETQKNGFGVTDGVLVNDPVQEEGKPHVSYGNLRTDQEFGDFNLKLEVNVPAGSNSGVYLKGMYEVQVLDSYGKPLDSHNMGGLYSRIAPSLSAEKPAGEWQSLDITLCDRHLTVLLNGKTIIDNQPVYGPTGGAIKSDVFANGPIYLQGDHGKVSYRNIILTPIVK